MTFDSMEQKNFVLDCVRKYPCTIQAALQFSRLYIKDIESGSIVVKQEKKKDDKNTSDNSGD